MHFFRGLGILAFSCKIQASRFLLLISISLPIGWGRGSALNKGPLFLFSPRSVMTKFPLLWISSIHQLSIQDFDVVVLILCAPNLISGSEHLLAYTRLCAQFHWRFLYSFPCQLSGPKSLGKGFLACILSWLLYFLMALYQPWKYNRRKMWERRSPKNVQCCIALEVHHGR